MAGIGNKVTREQIVAEARTWLGTPFVHLGREKGVGADCAGVLVGIARHFELPHQDVENYPAEPNGLLRGVIESQCERVPVSEISLADILVFRPVEEWQHFGVVSRLAPVYFIHAFAKKQIRRVAENSLDAQFWLPRLVAVYRFPGVE